MPGNQQIPTIPVIIVGLQPMLSWNMPGTKKSTNSAFWLTSRPRAHGGHTKNELTPTLAELAPARARRPLGNHLALLAQ